MIFNRPHAVQKIAVVSTHRVVVYTSRCGGGEKTETISDQWSSSVVSSSQKIHLSKRALDSEMAII